MKQVEIYLPPPSKWEDFETLIAEIARVKYDKDSVQKFGRRGQPQNGVDVYVLDYFKKKIGIQCKETKKSLTRPIILEEIEKVQGFSPSLDLFILATTQPTDVKVQQIVNEENERNERPFNIQIWFWDDIIEIINRSFHIMALHYQEFNEHFGVNETINHLTSLRAAFDRPAFKDNFLYELNYRDFGDALTSTKQLLRTGYLYDRWSHTLISQVVPTDLISDNKYKDFVLKVEKELEKIYRQWLRDKRKFEIGHRQDLAEKYNTSRRKLIKTLNEKLATEHISPVETDY